MFPNVIYLLWSGQSNLLHVVKSWTQLADAAVLQTPEKLIVNGVYVLKKHNVVDSGAQGWVYVIQVWNIDILEAREPHPVVIRLPPQIDCLCIVFRE